jgi:hypothetical protein
MGFTPRGAKCTVVRAKRQMGTKTETKELQGHIKDLIARLGWTQNELARVLYTELSDYDDEDEQRSFQEKLKKELQRDTTKPQRLRTYIEILQSHTDLEKVDRTANRYVPIGKINETVVKGMKSISKDIDKNLKEDRN